MPIIWPGEHSKATYDMLRGHVDRYIGRLAEPERPHVLDVAFVLDTAEIEGHGVHGISVRDIVAESCTVTLTNNYGWEGGPDSREASRFSNVGEVALIVAKLGPAVPSGDLPLARYLIQHHDYYDTLLGSATVRIVVDVGLLPDRPA